MTTWIILSLLSFVAFVAYAWWSIKHVEDPKWRSIREHARKE